MTCLHFFTLRLNLFVVLPRQGGFGILIRVELPVPYEATTCPRIALLCLSEVSTSMVSKIDYHMDRRHTLGTPNPKISCFKVIAWLLVFDADDSSRARNPPFPPSESLRNILFVPQKGAATFVGCEKSHSDVRAHRSTTATVKF